VFLGIEKIGKNLTGCFERVAGCWFLDVGMKQLHENCNRKYILKE
jgi:hypothetical protein